MLLLSTTVQYIRTRFADLRAREDGVTAVEYALMVAIIALLMVAGFFLLFENVKGSFENTGDCVVGGEAVLEEGCDPAAPADGGAGG
jgi:Flp pilus assembly pilin Flp